ncbi:hypothetical protein ES703_76592 [subsurface metagenome]
MVGFRGADNPLGAGKGYPGFEGRQLVLSPGFNKTQFMQVADDGRHAVITKTTGVDWWRNKGMPQGIHQDYRGESSYIPVVPGIRSLGHRGAACRLYIDDTQVWFGAINFIFDKRQIQSGKVGAAANAANDNIRVGICLLHHQFSCLQAVYRLVEQGMVDHAAYGILGIIVGKGIL